MKTSNLIFVMFFVAISLSLTAQNFDFRKSNWGMDSGQVKTSEASKLISSDRNSLNFSGKLADYDTKIQYNFTPSNQLYQTTYIINLRDKNPQSYVNTFLLLQDLLTQKYKSPSSKSNPIVNGKLLNQDDWAANMLSDNLNLVTKWHTDITDIVLSLFTLNNDLYLEINYTSIEKNKLNDEEKKMSILKDL